MKQKGFTPILVLIAIILIVAIGFVIYPNLNPTTVPVSSPSPETTIPNYQPADFVVNISPNQVISSPLELKGTVPAGWMYKGAFPVKLLDSNNDLIVQVLAHETVPGSWQSGNPVEFSATLKFTTDQTSGLVRLAKDNPSGLSENDASYDVPVGINPLENAVLQINNQTIATLPIGYKNSGPGYIVNGDTTFVWYFGNFVHPCPEFDPEPSNCTYLDEKNNDTPINVDTFRLWTDSSGVFAVNPIGIQGINNDTLSLYFQKEPKAPFTKQEISDWKKIISSIRNIN